MAKRTTVTVTCDRCGREQVETPLWTGWTMLRILKRNSRKLIFSRITWDSDWRFNSEIELCDDCLKSMRMWFAEGAKESR